MCLFARLRGNHQITVAQFSADSPVSLSVALPVPVRQGHIDEVRVISTSTCTTFFTDILRGLGSEGVPRQDCRDVAASVSSTPTMAGIPSSFLMRWPGYRDYAFVHFSIPPNTSEPHMVAFSFPSRHQNALYFPLLHSAGGDARQHVALNCLLVAQMNNKGQCDPWWQQSNADARDVLNHSRGLVDPYLPFCWGELSGAHPNGDRVVPIVP